jgi:hypothetical protein
LTDAGAVSKTCDWARDWRPCKMNNSKKSTLFTISNPFTMLVRTNEYKSFDNQAMLRAAPILYVILLTCFSPFILAQEARIPLNQWFEDVIAGREQPAIRNTILESSIFDLPLYDHLLESGLDLQEENGRIVIDKEVVLDGTVSRVLLLENLYFKKGLIIRRAASLENSEFGGRLNIENCKFSYLQIDESSFQKSSIENSEIHDLRITDNSSRDGFFFVSNTFSGHTTFRDNNDLTGIFFDGCTFQSVEPKCTYDSTFYGRTVSYNKQFEFVGSFIGSHIPVNLRLLNCTFDSLSGEDLSQRVVIQSPNIANLHIENSTFGSSLDLNGSVVEGKLIIRANDFRKKVVFNELILSEVFNILPWKQFSGHKLAVLEDVPERMKCEEPFDKSVIYLAQNEDELNNDASYEQLINMYHTIFTIARDRGDIEGGNGAYIEMKDIMTSKYRHSYYKDPNFETYFKWKLNVFLDYFTDYGTKPGRAVEKSIYVILIFAAFYFFFPSEWNRLGNRTLIGRFNMLLAYFRSEKTLYDIIYRRSAFADENKAFKLKLTESRREVPGYIYLMGKPITDTYDFFYSFEESVYHKFEILNGKWVELTKGRKILTAAVIGVFFIFYLLYMLILRAVNAITLSVNAFTTLGFGIIPTKGLARYVAIIQGFIGWFLLSIFIVALINQVLA